MADRRSASLSKGESVSDSELLDCDPEDSSNSIPLVGDCNDNEFESLDDDELILAMSEIIEGARLQDSSDEASSLAAETKVTKSTELKKEKPMEWRRPYTPPSPSSSLHSLKEERNSSDDHEEIVEAPTKKRKKSGHKKKFQSKRPPKRSKKNRDVDEDEAAQYESSDEDEMSDKKSIKIINNYYHYHFYSVFDDEQFINILPLIRDNSSEPEQAPQ